MFVSRGKGAWNGAPPSPNPQDLSHGKSDRDTVLSERARRMVRRRIHVQAVTVGPCFVV